MDDNIILATDAALAEWVLSVRLSAQGFHCDLSKFPQEPCEGGISVSTLQMEKLSLGGCWMFCLTPQTPSPQRHWSWKHLFFPMSFG